MSKVSEDVVWLEVPFSSLPEEQGPITEKGTSVAGKNVGFAIGNYQILANKEFLAANPVAKRWFELVKIPLEDINSQSLRIKNGENTPEDIRRHAEEWVEKNQQLFEEWIKAAKQVGN